MLKQMTLKQMTVRVICVVLICASLASLSSCSIARGMLGGQTDRYIESYSFDYLTDSIVGCLSSGADSCTLNVSRDGAPVLQETVDTDVAKLMAENGYAAYYMDRINYSVQVFSDYSKLTFHITYKDSAAVPFEDVIDIGGRSLADAVSDIADKMNLGSMKMALYVEDESLSVKAMEPIISAACVNAVSVPYTFDTYTCECWPPEGKSRIFQINLTCAVAEQDRATLFQKLSDAADAAIEELGESVSLDNTKQEICLAIHDYICEHTDYDESLVKDNSSSASWAIARSAYGALVDGKSTCGGYSAAFKLLYDKIIGDGLCRVVAGWANGNTDADRHAWNIVTDESKDYAIDCTFDDAESNGEEISHDYFYERPASQRFAKHTPEDFYKNN